MVRYKRIISYLCITAVLFASAGCSPSPAAKIDEKNLPDISTVVIGPQLKTEPAGILVEECAGAVIDYSSTAEGFVMMEYAGCGGNDIKAQVAGPETTYTYSLQNDKWAAFPLSEGDGEYTFTVFEDIGGGRYAMLVSVTAGVTLEDQFAPFIRPNQFVDYSDSPNAIAKAAQLADGTDDTLEIVGRVFTYVITSLTYDTEKAQTVKSGYLPVLEETLETGKGICFDYAALMTGSSGLWAYRASLS